MTAFVEVLDKYLDARDAYRSALRTYGFGLPTKPDLDAAEEIMASAASDLQYWLDELGGRE